MQLVTIGSKYQIVIPKEVRKKLKGIKPGVKVSVKPVDENTATLNIQEIKWSDRTYGLMQDAWKNIDPTAEINKMRDEWEDKVKELEHELEKI